MAPSTPPTHHVLPVSRDPLVGRRQAVEMLCLDRPLVDYLVQNGIIDRQQLSDIEAVSSARSNLVVLRCVDSAGRQGLELLLNGLRHTGQYELANTLDPGPRIQQNVQRHSFSSTQLSTLFCRPITSTV